jgi:histidyl-tRNA synthetase
MDIVGVQGVTAEVELLAAMVGVFSTLGLTSKDVGIKVNSRKVLGSMILATGVKKERFAEVGNLQSYFTTEFELNLQSYFTTEFD